MIHEGYIIKLNRKGDLIKPFLSKRKINDYYLKSCILMQDSKTKLQLEINGMSGYCFHLPSI